MTEAIDWKQQALKMANECRETIAALIANGMCKDSAVDLALSESTIGSGLKAQIRYEYK